MAIMLSGGRGARWLAPRPASLLFGLGKSQMAKLQAVGLESCGDIASLPEGRQRALLGSDAGRLVNLPAVLTRARLYRIAGQNQFPLKPPLAKICLIMPLWRLWPRHYRQRYRAS